MKKLALTIIISTWAAAAAFAALGDVVGTIPIPGGAQAGLGASANYLYITNYSQSRIYFVNQTTGSVMGSFANAGGSNTRGLACVSGGYLWQNKAYTAPFLSYQTNDATGSVYASFPIPSSVTHGIDPLCTGDGGAGTSYLLLSDYSAKRIYYMTTAGSIASSFLVTPILYEIAYDWRNELIWGGMNSNVCYAVSTTGSSVASFTAPTSNIYGMAYYGQYLFVGGTSGNIYRIHCPSGFNAIAPASLGRIKALYR